MKEKKMRTSDVAAMHDVAPMTVRRWITSGLLPAERIAGTYRIKRKDAEKIAKTITAKEATQ